jgi:malate synthase
MENEIIHVLNKNYNVDGQKVAESVLSGRLDRYNAMYYLTLKN